MDLFTPLKIGDLELSHRIIMAPLTRFRAENNVPNDMMAQYYEQRASEGGLIISETTCISAKAGILPAMPRIDTEDSIQGWKKIVQAVKDKKGFMFCQLNHFGRTIVPELAVLKTEVVSSSSNKLAGGMGGYEFSVPRPMNQDDMEETIKDFVNAAKNAITKCNFDGVELHGANGYLLDQFLEDSINDRTDEFGGSIENRIIFPLMLLDAVIAEVGSKKVGYRISPWDIYQDATDSDPYKHFSYFCEELEKRDLAYVHVVEARSDANGGRENDANKVLSDDLKDIRSSAGLFREKLLKTPLISAGGWKTNVPSLNPLNVDALAYGRYFISNPDLPERLKNGYPLEPYDRHTFYSPLTSKGYTDYLSYNNSSKVSS